MARKQFSRIAPTPEFVDVLVCAAFPRATRGSEVDRDSGLGLERSVRRKLPYRGPK